MRYKKHYCDMCTSDRDRARWVDIVERTLEDFRLIESVRQLNGISAGLFWQGDDTESPCLEEIEGHWLDEAYDIFTMDVVAFNLIKIPLQIKRYRKPSNAL